MAKFVDLSGGGFPKYSLPVESITFIESLDNNATNVYFLEKVIKVRIPYSDVLKLIKEKTES